MMGEGGLSAFELTDELRMVPKRRPTRIIPLRIP